MTPHKFENAPADLQWTPIYPRSGSKQKTHHLRISANGSVRLAPSFFQCCVLLLALLIPLGFCAFCWYLSIANPTVHPEAALSPDSSEGFVLFSWTAQTQQQNHIISIIVACATTPVAAFVMYRVVPVLYGATFDATSQTCRRLWKNVPFSEICGFQLLRKEIAVPKPKNSYLVGGSFSKSIPTVDVCYELNLVRSDATRIPLMCHGDLVSLCANGKTISDAVGVPLWNAA